MPGLATYLKFFFISSFNLCIQKWPDPLLISHSSLTQLSQLLNHNCAGSIRMISQNRLKNKNSTVPTWNNLCNLVWKLKSQEKGIDGKEEKNLQSEIWDWFFLETSQKLYRDKSFKETRVICMLGEGAILWIMRVMIDHKSPCCNVMFVPRTFHITPRPTSYTIYHSGYWAAVENNPATVYAAV